jgi:hypothetical protein
VSDSDPPAPSGRRVRRGEGEVTQWPRGLSGYVASGPEDEIPSPEEDRTLNRLRLAARLLAVLRADGEDVDREVRALAAARLAYQKGEKVRAGQLVDQLFGDLDQRRR